MSNLETLQALIDDLKECEEILRSAMNRPPKSRAWDKDDIVEAQRVEGLENRIIGQKDNGK